MGLISGNSDFVLQKTLFSRLQTDLMILFFKKYCYYRDKIFDRPQFFPTNTASQLKTTNQVRDDGEQVVL